MNFDILKTIGVDEKEVMSRFMNNEGFYIRVLKKFLDDKSYQELKDSLEAKDYESAFRAAHTLKGVSANLGLGNITRLSSDITEQLRSGSDCSDQVIEDRMKTLNTQYSAAMELLANL